MSQIQLTRADYEQQQLENRIALFGAEYVRNQEEREQGNAQDAATAAAISNLEEANQRLEDMLRDVLQNQETIAEGVSDVQQGVGDLQTGQLGIGNQIDNFRKKALAGIGALADNGGSWLDNCFPPRSTRAAVSCLADLILLFVQLYIFLAFTWFNLCRSAIGISGTLAGATPIIGGVCRPIVQAGMIVFLLWISTFVLTLFAFNTMSGTDQIINIIYIIRQFMAFIFRNIQNQLSNMRNDMQRIADESGLTDDYNVLREQTDRATAEMGTWVRGELANATANAVRNLPGNAMSIARSTASSLGDAAMATPGAVRDAARGVGGMIGNMFGYNTEHTELGGGKRPKKTRKRKHGKRKGKTRRGRGGTKEGDFIRINELTNEVLKETGVFSKYLLAVCQEFTFLCLHPKVSSEMRSELIDLFKKNPLTLKFNNPLVNMLSKTADGVLTSVKNDSINNDFKVNYIPFAKFYERVISDQKGGKRKKKRRGKKTKRKINRKRRLRKTRRN